MTGMANAVFCVFLFLFLSLVVFSILIYFKTESTKVPKPGHKMFFAYRCGEWSFKGIIAAGILGFAVFFIIVLIKVTPW